MGRPFKSIFHYNDVVNYICKNCKKEFQALRYRKRKVCSVSCNMQWNLENTRFGAKKGDPRRGNPQDWKHSEEFKEKRRGEGNPRWRGDKVGIHSLHSWIKDNFKKVLKCEICGTDESKKMYDWSNKDHKYNRKREDWWVLCRECHMNYDKDKFGNRRKTKE